MWWSTCHHLSRNEDANRLGYVWTPLDLYLNPIAFLFPIYAQTQPTGILVPNQGRSSWSYFRSCLPIMTISEILKLFLVTFNWFQWSCLQSYIVPDKVQLRWSLVQVSPMHLRYKFKSMIFNIFLKYILGATH